MEDTQNYFMYLPIRRHNIKTELYATTLGKAYIPPGEKHYPPPGHPSNYYFDWKKGRILAEFQMILIASGEGEYECTKYGRIALQAGSFIFVHPGELHRYRPNPKTGWTEYWVGIDGEYLCRLIRNGLFRIDHPVIIPTLQEPFIHRHNQLRELIEQRPGENTFFMSAYVGLILGEVQRGLETNLSSENTIYDVNQSHESELVHKAIQYICNHLDSIDTVEQITHEFSVTTRTLERHFIKEVGHSIWQEITQQRLQRAKDQLRKTTIPVAEIARSLGFKGVAGLRNLFQNNEHCTPVAYRQQHTTEKETTDPN